MTNKGASEMIGDVEVKRSFYGNKERDRVINGYVSMFMSFKLFFRKLTFLNFICVFLNSFIS